MNKHDDGGLEDPGPAGPAGREGMDGSYPALRHDPGVIPETVGEGLAAGLVVSEAARHLQSALDDLAQGQARLAAELARSRRRSAWLIGLLLLTVGAAAGVWYDHARAAPIVLPGQSRELDRQELVAEIEELSVQVHDARQERNRHLSESLRLREQLLESERRLVELTSGLGQLAGRVVEEPRPEVTVSATLDRDPSTNPAHALTQALRASGVDDFSIVEHGRLEQGVLFDVLVARHDRWGVPLGAEPFDRAHLQQRDGVVELVFERAATAAGDEARIERLPLPAADIEAWSAAGLELGRGLITVARAAEALALVLKGQTLELESLGGYDEGRFVDLVLVERDGRNLVRRSWSAKSAVLLPVGPALLLEEGHLEEGGDTRPFWNGHTRLILEGAAYGDFDEALRASAAGRETSRG